MQNLHSLFQRKTQPGVYWLDQNIPISDIEAQAQRANLAFYYLDGAILHNKTQFLNHIAVTLHFPTHFGNNWDALEDSLTDLSWADAAGYAILYDHTELFQEYAEDDFETALDIFRAATEFWQGQGKAMWVLLRGSSPVKHIIQTATEQT